MRWLQGPPLLGVMDKLGNFALLDHRGRLQSLRWTPAAGTGEGGGSGASSPRRSLSPARLLRRRSSSPAPGRAGSPLRPASSARSLSLPRPLRRAASPTMGGTNNPVFDGYERGLDRCLPAALWAPPSRRRPAERRFSIATFLLPGEARPGEALPALSPPHDLP